MADYCNVSDVLKLVSQDIDIVEGDDRYEAYAAQIQEFIDDQEGGVKNAIRGYEIKTEDEPELKAIIARRAAGDILLVYLNTAEDTANKVQLFETKAAKLLNEFLNSKKGLLSGAGNGLSPSFKSSVYVSPKQID